MSMKFSLFFLAMGGWGGDIDDPVMPQKYYIDCVRVYSFEE